MPIYLIDTIQQQGGASFPLLQDVDLKGGFRSVATEATRDTIPASFRETGMFVYTVDTGKLWKLTSLPEVIPGTWVEFISSSGVGNSLADQTLIAAEPLSAGWVVSINSVNQLIKSDASISGDASEPYGIVLNNTSTGSPADVVTNGIATFSPGGLTPGQILYLAEGGGHPTAVSFPNGSVSGRNIVRIGQARTSNTIQVRIQFVART